MKTERWDWYATIVNKDPLMYCAKPASTYGWRTRQPWANRSCDRDRGRTGEKDFLDALVGNPRDSNAAIFRDWNRNPVSISIMTITSSI